MKRIHIALLVIISLLVIAVLRLFSEDPKDRRNDLSIQDSLADNPAGIDFQSKTREQSRGSTFRSKEVENNPMKMTGARALSYTMKGMDRFMIGVPFGNRGVNSVAVRHYALTPDQEESLNLIAKRFQSKMVGHIMDSLERYESEDLAEDIDEGGEMIASWKYTPSELAERMVSDLTAEISEVVNEEFAEIAVKGTYNDKGLMCAGKYEIRILLIKSKNQKNREVDTFSIRFGPSGGSRMSMGREWAEELFLIEFPSE